MLFWAFRYFNSYFGLPLVADRAVLVPTAEDDPLIHVDALDRFFALPRGFLFLTPEEEALDRRARAGQRSVGASSAAGSIRAGAVGPREA